MRSVTEAQFQDQIIAVARLLGWRAAHFRPAMTKAGNWVTAVAADGKGFPDLVLVRERLVFVELKSQRGRLTTEQAEWIRDFGRAGVEVYVWRPTDFDEAYAILQRRGR